MRPFPSAKGWMHRKSSTYVGSSSSGSTPLVSRAAIPIVELRHRVGNEVWRERLEPDDRRSVRPRFGDVVVGRLPASATAGHELKQIAMQLQHETRRELHFAEIRVNRVQDITVSSELLFWAVRRLGSGPLQLS